MLNAKVCDAFVQIVCKGFIELRLFTIKLNGSGDGGNITQGFINNIVGNSFLLSLFLKVAYTLLKAGGCMTC